MNKRPLIVALGSLLIIAAMLISAFAVQGAFAKGVHTTAKASGSGVTISSQKGASQTVSAHVYNLKNLQTVKNAPARSHTVLPLRGSPNLAAYKKSAVHNKNAPARGTGITDSSSNTRSGIVGFNGMADSATICPYFGGCQPPDMALATSPTLVLQGVNTSYAFYDTHGNLVAGPINDQVWYGVPNPPNNCDPNGPFLSDPRAFYDPNTGLFWTATLQVESAVFGVGVNCPNLSLYWIANINPATGVMHVYSFDMTLGGTVNAGADYTQFGFSRDVIAFSGNMFDFTTGSFDFAEVQFANKAAMEQGLPVTTSAFTGLSATGPNGTIYMDTIQPVETITPTNQDPGVEYLINTFNIFGDPFGDDCLFTACQGFVTWAFDPSNSSLTGTFVGTGVPNPTYVAPPPADEPGCLFCVETLDTRISGTPVYSLGGGQPLISFSIDTGVNNGGPAFPNVVPGILWGQVQVSHGPGFVIANLYQSGYLYYSNDRAASFGAMMQDKNGQLFMVYDTMSANLNPSIMIAQRGKSTPLGNFGNTRFVIKGPAATFDSRWGDFEAASYTGFGSNHVWVASQYSISGDWATYIARVS
jgi:hypothetical protein